MARHEFIYAKEFAEKLRGITDLVQVSYYNPECKDGFDASQAEDVYKFFKKKYGNWSSFKSEFPTLSFIVKI